MPSAADIDGAGTRPAPTAAALYASAVAASAEQSTRERMAIEGQWC